MEQVINSKDNIINKSAHNMRSINALYVACKRGHIEIVKALLHSLEICDQIARHHVLLMQDENGIGGIVQKGP